MTVIVGFFLAGFGLILALAMAHDYKKYGTLVNKVPTSTVMKPSAQIILTLLAASLLWGGISLINVSYGSPVCQGIL